MNGGSFRSRGRRQHCHSIKFLVLSIQPSKENSDTKEKKANHDLRLDGEEEENTAAWRRTKEDGAEMSTKQKNGDDEKM